MAGGEWKRAQAATLSKKCQGLYTRYVEEQHKANEAGRILREAVTAEWREKFPQGKDGKFLSFNSSQGILYYKELTKTPRGVTKAAALDMKAGTDVMGGAAADKPAAA
jgi:hypothetical protein